MGWVLGFMTVLTLDKIMSEIRTCVFFIRQILIFLNSCFLGTNNLLSEKKHCSMLYYSFYFYEYKVQLNIFIKRADIHVLVYDSVGGNSIIYAKVFWSFQVQYYFFCVKTQHKRLNLKTSNMSVRLFISIYGYIYIYVVLKVRNGSIVVHSSLNVRQCCWKCDNGRI